LKIFLETFIDAFFIVNILTLSGFGIQSLSFGFKVKKFFYLQWFICFLVIFHLCFFVYNYLLVVYSLSFFNFTAFTLIFIFIFEIHSCLVKPAHYHCARHWFMTFLWAYCFVGGLTFFILEKNWDYSHSILFFIFSLLGSFSLLKLTLAFQRQYLAKKEYIGQSEGGFSFFILFMMMMIFSLIGKTLLKVLM
jgi:hypothetical protein